MSLCSRCHTEFTCAVADQTGAPCWCMNLPRLDLKELPEQDGIADASCLCPHCLHELVEQQAAQKNRNG